MAACPDRGHVEDWRVAVRNANYSTFNGGHRTWSAYSEMKCLKCGAVWRTKAGYVKHIPSLGRVER